MAAEQGLNGAQFTLGYCYANGYDVPQGYTEADIWCLLAKTDERERKSGRENMLQAMKSKLSPEQLIEAQRRDTEKFDQIEER